MHFIMINESKLSLLAKAKYIGFKVCRELQQEETVRNTGSKRYLVQILS